MDACFKSPPAQQTNARLSKVRTDPFSESQSNLSARERETQVSVDAHSPENHAFSSAEAKMGAFQAEVNRAIRAAVNQGLTSAQVGQGANTGTSRQFSGRASYYDTPNADTASGEKFDANKMAGAMTRDKANLGQTVTVTYSHVDKNGKVETRTISVVINDRGPFAMNAKGAPLMPLRPHPSRIIDLTPAAFMQLVGTTKPGTVPVTVTVPNE
jgi:rare lipoprotein A (peptidoglycan hydrolase)